MYCSISKEDLIINCGNIVNEIENGMNISQENINNLSFQLALLPDIYPIIKDIINKNNIPQEENSYF